MSPDEVNERAWNQMKVMTDEEIKNHPTSENLRLYYGPTNIELDIWDFRIAVRDFFFNELWREVKPLWIKKK